MKQKFSINRLTLAFASLLLAVVLQSCSFEPCKHENIYENCSKYEIEWSEGFRQDFENIYDYKIEGNCATITEGEVCFRCGSVIGFTQRQICGSFRVRNHTYCR
jgi:hypothetical protein